MTDTAPAPQRAKRKRRNENDIPRRVQYGAFGPELVNLGYGSVREIEQSGRSIQTTTLSSDAHARHDLQKLRQESQRLDRDNAIYSAMITRVLDVVLGEGVALQANTGDAALNTRVEAMWSDWWAAPEIRGMDDGCDFERLILRHLLVDGDVLIVKTTEGLAQLIVADQYDTLTGYSANRDGTRTEQGISLSDVGRPLAFYVQPFDAYGNLRYSAKEDAIPASQCIYLAHRRRVDQTRGEPIMQSAFPMLHRINDVCDSEAAAWQLLSRLAIAVTRKDAATLAYATSAADPEQTANEAAQSLASRIQDFGLGVIFNGEPGDEIKGIERNVPGSNFTESLKTFLRILGLPLGFSLEFTLLIWSDTNYSSGRASVKQVERNTRPLRNKMRKALSGLYEWKLLQWAKELGQDGNPALFKHDWHFSPYPFIDPEKERAAQVEAVKSGLSTMTRESLATGDDYPTLLREQSRDIEAALQAAAALSAKYPQAGVTWRDFRPSSPEKPAAAAPAPAPPAPPSAGGLNGA